MWSPQSLQFTANNPFVEVVRHAVALDERRAYFPQNLWGHDPAMPTDVQQVWFPGVHCDVGGGYAEREAGLSKLALKWMAEQAQAFGLRFDPKAMAAILPTHDSQNYVASSVAALQHESLSGWWWIAEFIPKRIKDPAAGYATRWILHAGRHRHVGEKSNIHASVIERKEQVASYRPTNLPDDIVQIQ
jgi:uncharacterized protein (DUF2235 family)